MSDPANPGEMPKWLNSRRFGGWDMATTIQVLEHRAIEIKEALDELPCVVGTGIHVIEKPIWGGLGFVKCETLLTRGGRYSDLHAVPHLLRSRFNLDAFLTAGQWARWEWAIYSISAVEYEVRA